MPPATSARNDDTNLLADLSRQFLVLQGQLHDAQQAIERGRKEANETAVQTATALAGRLESLEAALAERRSRELDAMQSSNRVMLIVAGTFAGVGFLAMLLMVFFQWRAVNRLAEVATALPSARALGMGTPYGALGAGESVVTAGPAERSNARLLGALERLEKRIYELEHTAQPPLPAPSLVTAAPLVAASPQPADSGDARETATTADARNITALLGRGQALLDEDKPEAAAACLDELLQLQPDHAEALVKKGAALEKLRKLNEAIECYDRAIAADGSMTIAYLHKGGLFNRMEKFAEALECYEQALRTQEKKAA